MKYCLGPLEMNSGSRPPLELQGGGDIEQVPCGRAEWIQIPHCIVNNLYILAGWLQSGLRGLFRLSTIRLDGITSVIINGLRSPSSSVTMESTESRGYASIIERSPDDRMLCSCWATPFYSY